MEIMNRCEGLDLLDRLPEELWTVVHNIVKCIGRQRKVNKYPNSVCRLSAKEIFDEALVCKIVKEL